MALASPEELEKIASVDDARNWAELSSESWDALNAELGNCKALRILAFIPLENFHQAMDIAMVPASDGAGRPRYFNDVERTQARLMRQLARLKFGKPDDDPMEARAAAAAAAPREPKEPETATEQPRGLGAEIRDRPLVPADGEKTPWKRPPKAALAAPRPGARPTVGLGAGPAAPAPMLRQPGDTKAPETAVQVLPARPRPRKEAKGDLLPDPVAEEASCLMNDFYATHRRRGLILGPRYRSVNFACGTYGSAYSVLDQRQPARREPVPPPDFPGYGVTKKDGVEFHGQIGGRHEALPLGDMTRADKEALPGGFWPRMMSAELAGAKLPQRRKPKLAEATPWVWDDKGDAEEFADDTWAQYVLFHPSVYDGCLSTLFMSCPPVHGGLPTALPIPFHIADVKLLPHAMAAPYFGRTHPANAEASKHYFEVSADGVIVSAMDGFQARETRPEKDAKKKKDNEFVFGHPYRRT